MSERLTDAERSAIAALVHELYEKWQPPAGKKSWASWARHIGVSEYSLAEWRSGRGAPSAVNLLKLISSGGWDAPAVQPAPIGVMLQALENQEAMRQDYEAVLRRLQSIEERVGLVAEGVSQLLEARPGDQKSGRGGR